MKISADTLNGPLLSVGYPQTEGVYDEMSAAPGVLRPHWDQFINSLSALGGHELAWRWQTARQRIRENGVTYNVYGDPQGMDRPWNLDPIPLMIRPSEWSPLEAGLIQRARLLNLILADLYGPQQLLRGGLIPPALVFANPGFWRPCHGVGVSGNTYLHLLAVDLARGPDGEWWVISDRTQAPSGAGYALENRIVMAETFPDLFREFQVKRLASFYRSFRDTLLRLSPRTRDNPRVVLLSPGPFNETYFEHSYLARYLGFTLVQGGDLTVRDSRVLLKTLEGLKQVDVILRRLDDGFCDPIELRSDSYLGVAGLMEAVRAGNVSVANALGSGLIETSAFMPFFPGLCKKMLGEDMKLPAAATWWCGQPAALNYVLENLDHLVIKPAFPSKGMEPVFGGKLAAAERTRLIERIKESPHDYAGQELLNLSSAPVWSEEHGLAPRRVVLRVYLAAEGDSWIVIPGGLARVSVSIDTPVVSMQRGGGSKDAWVLSDSPVDTFSLQRPRDVPVELSRGVISDLPSRAADHIFWLGRYAERSEHLARMLRCILIRLTGESGAPDQSEWESLTKLYECLESPHTRLAKDEPQTHPDPLRDLEQEILSRIFEEQRSDSLTAILNRATRSAAQVRDRLSSDMLRVVSQFSMVARSIGDPAWGYVSVGDALAVLNSCIQTLAALRGIEMENMTRGPGWHFLGIGRRIERSVQLVKMFRTIIVPLTPQTWPALEMLLEVADSSMTYRSRYFTIIQPAPVLDLLMNEEVNPRSLAFQMKDLFEHCRSLSYMPWGEGWPFGKQKRLEEAASNLFRTDVRVLCEPGGGEFAHITRRTSLPTGNGFAGFLERHQSRVFQPRRAGGDGLIYRVRHRTTYTYEDTVSVSHHLVRLTPREFPGQFSRGTHISILPSPPDTATRYDYFGNIQTFFALREPHDCLIVEANSELEVRAVEHPNFSASPAWESVKESVASDHSEEGLDAYQFVFGSQRVSASRELGDYARTSFLAGRPLLEATFDLTARINRDFSFDTKATEVTTPVQAFFEKRRGVCQDFAHLQIACMRSLGLPARYISGYLRTLPPPGKPRLVGADASHAWCSVWSPGAGWVDFDPTNNCVPTDGHITVAWGRDYSDVSPIHGVLLGGAKHTLDVGVDVTLLQ